MTTIRSKRITTNIGPRCKFQLGTKVVITATKIKSLADRVGQTAVVIARTTYLSRHNPTVQMVRHGRCKHFYYRANSDKGFTEQWIDYTNNTADLPADVREFARAYIKVRGMGDQNFYYVRFADGQIKRIAGAYAKKVTE